MWNPSPPQGFTNSQGLVIIGRPPIPRFGSPQVLLPPILDKMAYETLDTMAYEPADWYLWNWEARVVFEVNPLQVPSTQFNFPTLVSAVIPSLIFNNPDKFRFTDSNNILLPYEIINFIPATGEILAWVLMPSISDGDTINFYFANLFSVDDEQDPNALWEDYQARYSLGQVPSGPNTILDSTVNQNHGTPTGTTRVPAKIGYGLSFDSALQDFVHITNFDVSFDFTMSIWFKTTQVVDGVLFSVFTTNHGILSENNPDGTIRFLVRNPPGTGGGTDLNSSNSFNDDEWHLAHYIFDSVENVQKLYVDKILEGSAANTQSLMGTMSDCLLGQLLFPPNDIRNFEGVLDEFRVYRGVYTEDRIITENNNQNNPSSFLSIKSIDDRPDESTLDIMGYEA